MKNVNKKTLKRIGLLSITNNKKLILIDTVYKNIQSKQTVNGADLKKRLTLFKIDASIYRELRLIQSGF